MAPELDLDQRHRVVLGHHWLREPRGQLPRVRLSIVAGGPRIGLAGSRVAVILDRRERIGGMRVRVTGVFGVASGVGTRCRRTANEAECRDAGAGGYKSSVGHLHSTRNTCCVPFGCPLAKSMPSCANGAAHV